MIKYKCHICGEETYRIYSHAIKKHSDVRFVNFVSKQLFGLDSPPKCKYCENECEWSYSNKKFNLTCSSEECKRKGILDKLSLSLPKVHESQRLSCKGVYNPEVRKESNERMRASGTGFFDKEKRREWSKKGALVQKQRGTLSFQIKEIRDKATETLKVKSTGFYDPNIRDLGRVALAEKYGIDKKSAFMGRLYVVKVVDNISGIEYCKVGIGNPWNRWCCILELLPNLEILTFMETKFLGNARVLEAKLHSKFSWYKTFKIPNITGMFLMGSKKFPQSTGSSEWFEGDSFEIIISDIDEEFELHDVTEEFAEYYNKSPITLLKG